MKLKLLSYLNSKVIDRQIYDWPSHNSVALIKWNDYNYLVNSNNLKYHLVEATIQFNNAIVNKLSEDMSVMVELKLVLNFEVASITCRFKLLLFTLCKYSNHLFKFQG